ncbi:MAG TPA: TonB-dependent receptor [Caulobacteraceae bacterium]|nr:TonB-dependent receptor [Caulobacteraceae bacterium]
MKNTRTRLMATSMITGAALLTTWGTVAHAATATATATAADQAAAVQEVVITGSRIPTPNLTSVAPVRVINNQEIKLQGTTQVEDLLNNLPQVAASYGGNIANGSTGTSTVNLRNLGPTRTLVLIDGRRMGAGDPTELAADLNFIPAPLIDRVEIDTAAASSIYGSDAVAGVVNFIMKKNFVGAEADVNYGFYNHSQQNSAIRGDIAAHGFQEPASDVTDGFTTTLTGIVGVNSPDDRGNATAYISYRHVDPVTQATRDFSGCALGEAGNHFTCAGSATSPTGTFFLLPFGAAGAPSTTLVDTLTGTGSSTSFRAFNPATDEYNYGPLNYFQVADETYTGGVFAHYEVNKHFDVYSQVMFMDDQTFAQIAPSGVFGQTFNLNCNDPLLTASEASTICGAAAGTTAVAPIAIARRNVEGGPRTDDRRHTDYRLVLGTRGDITDNWHYDIYGLYDASVFSDVYENDVSLAKAQLALNDCVGAPTTGLDSGCVPWNIFQGGGVTPAATNYITTPGFQTALVAETVVEGSVNGDLGAYGVKSPWAQDGVGLAVGADYRREALTYRTDEEFLSGDLAGQGGPRRGTNGAYEVGEAYFEVRAPLIEDAPFFKSLVLHGSYRYSNYSISGSTNTYEVGPTWRIDDDVMLRGGYNRAVRAPNLDELFNPQVVALDFNVDPCAGSTGLPSLAQCEATGVTAAQYGHIASNPASQYNGLLGGNPDLKPELADTWSGGIVLTPHFVPGLAATVDYYNIDVQNAINGIGAQTIINQCVATQNPTYCSLIHRAPGTGSLWLGTNGFVTDTSQNVADYRTSGFDVTGAYRLSFEDMNWGNYGSLNFDFEGTYTINYDVTTAAGLGTFNCVGLYGDVCQGTGTPMTAPSPKWRHTFRITWTPPWYGLGFSAQWRYLGSLTSDACTGNPLLSPAKNCFAADSHLPAVNYFDLEASWRIKTGYTARVGVNNVLDQDPPVIGSKNLPAVVGSGNTFAQFYDVLGRYVFFNVTADF